MLTGSAVSGFADNPLSGFDATLVREGDIIFRRGTDAISRAVLSADQESRYSHVGLVVIQDGLPMVVHAIPAEAPDDIDGVKMESLTVFTSRAHASAVGLYRLRDDKRGREHAHRAALYALSRLSAPFDFDFDAEDPEHVYCTELVWRAYHSAGIQIVDEARLQNFPLVAGKVIAPSAIWNARTLHEVKGVAS